MTIHEYGVGKEKVIVLVHPSAVMWDYFTYVIQILKNNYHLIVPTLPGYDESNPHEDFTSVEEIADNLAQWLIAQRGLGIPCKSHPLYELQNHLENL